MGLWPGSSGYGTRSYVPSFRHNMLILFDTSACLGDLVAASGPVVRGGQCEHVPEAVQQGQIVCADKATPTFASHRSKNILVVSSDTSLENITLLAESLCERVNCPRSGTGFANGLGSGVGVTLHMTTCRPKTP